MNLYRVQEPQPCDIEDCHNTNAVLVVRTAKGLDHAICPTCVRTMRQMSANNALFFAQEPLPGTIRKQNSENTNQTN